MLRSLSTAISLVALFLGACAKNNSPADSSELAFNGIEECSNKVVGVHSIAEQLVGPSWTYTYKGQTWKVSSLERANCNPGECRVEHVDEKVISHTCKDGELVNRKSIRRVILRDESRKVVLDTVLKCEGNFPNGIYPVKGLPLPSCK